MKKFDLIYVAGLVVGSLIVKQFTKRRNEENEKAEKECLDRTNEVIDNIFSDQSKRAEDAFHKVVEDYDAKAQTSIDDFKKQCDGIFHKKFSESKKEGH